MGRRNSPGGGPGRSADGARIPAAEIRPVQLKLKFKEPLKPELCRRYLRERFAEGFPQIVDTFIEKAAGGSLQHTKVMISLGGFEEGPAPTEPVRGRGGSLIRRVLEEMRAHRLACSNGDTMADDSGNEPAADEAEMRAAELDTGTEDA